MISKVLFWLFSGSFTLIIVASSFKVKWTAADWIGDIALGLGMLGLYGYAYKKHIWSKRIWIGITIAISIYWVLYSFYVDQQFGAYPPKTDGDSIITFVGGLPALLSAALYARKLKH